MKQRLLTIILTVSIISQGCADRSSNEIVFFHAGSLAVPVAELVKAYEAENPGIRIITEAAGSLVTARKITELGKPCDIMASADYQVIDELLIPGYAAWNIGFATNEIVIAFTPRSRYSEDISDSNWTDILLRDNVFYGRSDPDSDPCGYRTLMTLKLAEEWYGIPGLAERFSQKDRSFIRPKEIDLTALLETGAVDYVFQYKSVAVQHGQKFLELPAEINLGDPEFSERYRSVSVDVAGRSPGETMTIRGDYILYGITLLNNAPNREEAEKFLAFILSPGGRSVIELKGQNPVVPPVVKGSTGIPEPVQREIIR